MCSFSIQSCIFHSDFNILYFGSWNLNEKKKWKLNRASTYIELSWFSHAYYLTAQIIRTELKMSPTCPFSFPIGALAVGGLSIFEKVLYTKYSALGHHNMVPQTPINICGVGGPKSTAGGDPWHWIFSPLSMASKKVLIKDIIDEEYRIQWPFVN